MKAGQRRVFGLPYLFARSGWCPFVSFVDRSPNAHPPPPPGPRRDRPLLPLQLALALLAALVLGLSACFPPGTLLPGLDLCTFHRLTGLPCPGCGLTRAFCALTHGDVRAAWHFNPFSLAFYAGCLLLLAWPLLSAWQPALETRLIRSKWCTRGPLLLVLAMWVYGLVRIAGTLLVRTTG